MDNSGIVERIRQDTWLQTAFKFLRENLTTANLVGLIGGVSAILILLAPLPEAWNIRLPFYLVIFVWTILRPRVALYLMPIAVPWGSLDIITVGGLNLNSADVLVIFLAASWLMSFALRPGALLYRQVGTSVNEAGPRDRIAFNSSNVSIYLVWAIIILLGTMLLSMMAAINISSSLKEVSKWLEFLVLVLLGAQYIRTRRQVWTIIVLVCVAGITQAMYGYFQAFFNLGPEAFIRDTSLRVYGTFGQPNPFAGYINLSLSISLALMLLGSNWRTRLLAGLSAILLAGAEYLTQSRGGEIAIAVATLFIVIVGLPHLRKLMALLALAGLGVVEVFFAGWIPAYVLSPVFKFLGLIQISFVNPSNDDYSTAERLAHWIAGVHMFLSHPLIGVGIGNYPDAYPGYFITIFVNSLGHAHNYYINIAAETGAIGLTAYLLFLMAIFVTGGSSLQAISKKYKNDRALAIGLLAALISVCVHNLVDDLYVHSLTNLIALLLIALIRLEGVTTKAHRNGGDFDYRKIAK